jgi:Protein kinase domain/WD domain, G-beta repeat
MEALRPGDPVSVGPYRLTGRLGGGGMGQVYLAETPGGRKVAVKLIHASLARTAQFRERFAREVEAARRVGGFHTAQVVDADPQADPPWMVTAYIDGPSLEEAVGAGGPLPPDEVRALGAALAEGLAAIHACGLVHRDLKPGNVILGTDGPRIIDFGIVRSTDQAKLTQTGTVLGTLAYMSPEQLGGLAPEQLGAVEVGPASDVFSLGDVLAFAATARPPFGDDLAAAIIHRILSQPPDLAGLADEQLRQLITACLAKSPADRPALADILVTLRADRRRPPPVTQVSQTVTLSARISFGAVAFSPDGRLLAGAGDHQPVRKTRRATRYWKVWLWDLANGEVRHTLTGLRGLAFSPDGRLLASGSESAQVQLWDPASGEHRRTLYCVYPSPVVGVAFSPDGRLVAGSTHQGVWLWDPASGEHRRTLSGRGGEFFWGVAFSPDGRLLASAGSDGTVWLWDPASGEHRRTLTGHEGDGTRKDVYGVAFSPDGRLLASAGTDKTVRLWDPAAGGAVAVLTGHTGVVSSVAFSPDGRMLASTGSTDSTVRLWDPGSRAVLATLAGHTGVVSAAAFSPDGRMLASAGGDKTVRLWFLTQAGR